MVPPVSFQHGTAAFVCGFVLLVTKKTCLPSRRGRKRLLDSVSGQVGPGFTAIMGESKAGAAFAWGGTAVQVGCSNAECYIC